MKIDSNKFASVPRVAVRPQPAPAATSNTGIVPTAKRPSDSFQSSSARPGTAAAGNTGGVAKTPGKTTLNTDFALDPSLEKHRDLFAKVGARIAKLPTEELRAKAIDRTSNQLSKVLKQPLDKVREGVTNAAMAAMKGPNTLNDPQECFAYRSDRMLNFSSAIQAVGGQLKDLGLSLSKDTTLKSKSQILDAAKSQLSQLNLQGREAKVAERYILGLVREDRARTGGFTGGTVRPPRFHSDTFQLFQRRER